MSRHLLTIKHLPYIDGLRAVAILPVLIFHAFPERLSWGFVGVDIFFVISGFLITSLLVRAQNTGSFSVTDFYARRIRRLFPALALVMAATFALGWVVLQPSDYARLGTEMAAGAAFAENLLLLQQAGYFDTATVGKPLMHLWSLAVEEQFYLLFPLLLWGAWRLKMNLRMVVGAVFLLSLGLSIFTSDTTLRFFAPQYRFWELMVGALLALPGETGRPGLVVWAGLSLLAAEMFLSGQDATAASHAEFLIPVAVACATWVIVLGRSAWVNRVLLSNQHLGFVGRISYPLYLWHWPLLSIAHITGGGIPSNGWRAGLLGASFVLAALTYWLVERRGTVPVLVAAMAMIGVAGWVSHRNGGFPERVGSLSGQTVQLKNLLAGVPRFSDLDSEILPASFRGATNRCAYIQSGGTDDSGLVRLGKASGKRIMFVGDSHTRHYIPAIFEALRRHPDLNLEVLVCAHPGHREWENGEIASDRPIRAVVLSHFWALGLNTNAESAKDRMVVRVATASDHVGHALTDMDAAAFDRLEAWSRQLRTAGTSVWFILDNPTGHENDPRSMLLGRGIFRPVWDARLRLTTLTRDQVETRREPWRSRILQIAGRIGAQVIDPLDTLCARGACPAFSADDKPLYQDYDHLSLNGSLYHVPYIEDLLVRVAAEDLSEAVGAPLPTR